MRTRVETHGDSFVKRLDKYTFRKFITWVGLALLTFLSLFYIIDVVDNLDKFIDRKAELVDVVMYYLTYLPYMVVLVSPIVLLLASSFSCGQMSKNREIVAARSGGISSVRVALPILIFGLIWSLVIMAFGEFVVPRTNALRDEIKNERIYKKQKDKTGRIKDLLYQTDDGRVLSIQTLDPRRERARNVLIIHFSDDDRVEQLIRARKMIYKDDMWELQDGHHYTFLRDSTSLYEYFTNRELDLSETPQELAERRADPDEMGFFELKKFIERVQRAGGDPLRERTDLLMKISYPFINFIILLFGVPLVLRFRRGGLVTGFAQSVTIAFVYFGAVKVGQVLGYNGNIPPWLAVTSGNFLFAAAGFFLLFTFRE